MKIETSSSKAQALEILRESLPPIIAWCQVDQHLNKLISKQTLFNAATKGEGPESFMIGNRRCSLSDVLVDWLARR